MCGLHQRRRALGEPMVQDHDLVGLTPSGFGLLGIVERDQTAVMCHECGRWLGGLSWHVTKVHEVTVGRGRGSGPGRAGVSGLRVGAGSAGAGGDGCSGPGG